jgi:hypothetical protein
MSKVIFWLVFWVIVGVAAFILGNRTSPWVDKKLSALKDVWNNVFGGPKTTV